MSCNSAASNRPFRACCMALATAASALLSVSTASSFILGMGGGTLLFSLSCGSVPTPCPTCYALSSVVLWIRLDFVVGVQSTPIGRQQNGFGSVVVLLQVDVRDLGIDALGHGPGLFLIGCQLE